MWFTFPQLSGHHKKIYEAVIVARDQLILKGRGKCARHLKGRLQTFKGFLFGCIEYSLRPDCDWSFLGDLLCRILPSSKCVLLNFEEHN
jgi:hypothetical protein